MNNEPFTSEIELSSAIEKEMCKKCNEMQLFAYVKIHECNRKMIIDYIERKSGEQFDKSKDFMFIGLRAIWVDNISKNEVVLARDKSFANAKECIEAMNIEKLRCGVKNHKTPNNVMVHISMKPILKKYIMGTTNIPCNDFDKPRFFGMTVIWTENIREDKVIAGCDEIFN